MGLDQYLYANRFVSGYDFHGEEERKDYARALKLSGMARAAAPDTPHAEIQVTVAYWRKANAIHKWFVDNVQGGEDECRPHYVAREQLEELRKVCANAIAARDKVGAAVAQEILPTQAGFFFGSTDYDEWFWETIEDTLVQIDRVLTFVPETCELYYRSSW